MSKTFEKEEVSFSGRLLARGVYNMRGVYQMNKKKITLISMLSVIFILLATVSTAGTIGNPLPGVPEGRWRVTAELDNWDKDMDEGTDLESTRLLAKFTYGISGKVNIFGRIGFAEFEVGSADSDYEPAWGAGAKIKVYEKDNIDAGIVAQIFHFSGDFSGADFDVTEIDIACGANHQFTDVFLGYFGFSISMVEIDFDNGGDHDEDDPFFFFGGIEFKVNNATDIGLEIRTFGESSITLLANFDF
ncbi:MAG: hypothetical protein KJ737_25480 [Proteobacteria bacterium]|nr:hypothetical protein [Pseudomonadota bacterium]